MKDSSEATGQDQFQAWCDGVQTSLLNGIGQGGEDIERSTKQGIKEVKLLPE